MNGVVIVDKPGGMTSHDVVDRVRRVLKQRAVGHLGTLDPSATGVLPIVTGNLTRLAQFYLHCEKEYEGEIRLGFATDTYDADGEATTAAQDAPDPARVKALADEFRGVIEQLPPPFSAKKIAGIPAYKLARKKKDVPLIAARVEIHNLEILSVTGDVATFRARVSSGTYMRSIAHDMGMKLGCGAHLGSLRRTRVAEFEISASHPLDELEQAERQGSVEDLFVHPRKLLPGFPCVTASDEAAALIRSGRAVNLPELSRAPRIKVLHGQSELIAIATRVAGTLFHPGIVFASAREAVIRR